MPRSWCSRAERRHAAVRYSYEKLVKVKADFALSEKDAQLVQASSLAVGVGMDQFGAGFKIANVLVRRRRPRRRSMARAWSLLLRLLLLLSNPPTRLGQALVRCRAELARIGRGLGRVPG